MFPGGWCRVRTRGGPENLPRIWPVGEGALTNHRTRGWSYLRVYVGKTRAESTYGAVESVPETQEGAGSLGRCAGRRHRRRQQFILFLGSSWLPPTRHQPVQLWGHVGKSSKSQWKGQRRPQKRVRISRASPPTALPGRGRTLECPPLISPSECTPPSYGAAATWRPPKRGSATDAWMKGQIPPAVFIARGRGNI